MGFLPDAYDALAVDQGAVGDVARSFLTNPAEPGESVADTQARTATQAGARARIQAIKGKQLAARGVPSYQDMQGNTQPVVDDSGSPLNKLDARHSIAYDSAGEPKKIEFDDVGSPVLKDPFDGLQPTTDKKTGHQYQVAPGLPWRWVGTDAEVAQNADFAREDSMLGKASATLGRKLTLTEHDAVLHQKAMKGAHGQLAQLGVATTDANGDPLEYDALVAGINSQFDNLKKTDKAANAKSYFGLGDPTPEAIAAQSVLDLSRTAALRAAATGHAHAQSLAQIRDQAEAVRAQRMLLEERKLANEAELLKRQGIDISTPAQPEQSADAPAAPAEDAQPGALQDTGVAAKPDQPGVLGDLAISVGAGTFGMLKMAGDLYGLITGDRKNIASRIGKIAVDDLHAAMSGEHGKLDEERAKAVKDAPDELGKAWEFVKHTLASPRLMAGLVAENVPNVVGTGGVGLLAKQATAKVLLKNAATEAAQKLAMKKAVGVGVAAAVGTGAVMQGADVGGDQFDDLMSRLDAMPAAQAAQIPEIADLMDRGATLDEAKLSLSLTQARKTGALAGFISLASQRLPGAQTIEKALVGGAAGKGAVRSAIKGALGEATQEMVEEGGGLVAKNKLAQPVDPSRPITQGLGETIAQAGLASGPMGAVTGGLHSERGGAPPSAPETSTEPPAPETSPAQPTPQPVGGIAPFDKDITETYGRQTDAFDAFGNVVKQPAEVPAPDNIAPAEVGNVGAQFGDVLDQVSTVPESPQPAQSGGEIVTHGPPSPQAEAAPTSKFEEWAVRHMPNALKGLRKAEAEGNTALVEQIRQGIHEAWKRQTKPRNETAPAPQPTREAAAPERQPPTPTPKAGAEAAGEVRGEVAPGTRHLETPESRDYIKQGGWKLHLTVKPENYKAVDEWLDANHPGQYKLLNGGDSGEKDFTVYVGDKRSADALSERIHGEIGSKIEPSNAGAEDVKFGEKVAGRFDVQKTRTPYEYYGRNGIPFDRAAKDVEMSKMMSKSDQDRSEHDRMLASHEARIRKELAQKYGERFTGEAPAAKPSAPVAKEAAAPVVDKPSVKRGPRDDFGGESTPVAAFIINDLGGMMSKSSAKKRGLLPRHSDQWEAAPRWSDPTHNKLYNPASENTPSTIASRLHDAGLLADGHLDTLWEALRKESKSAKKARDEMRSLENQQREHDEEIAGMRPEDLPEDYLDDPENFFTIDSTEKADALIENTGLAKPGSTKELPQGAPDATGRAGQADTEGQGSAGESSEVAPGKPTTYINGDKAEYTGETRQIAGGTFHVVTFLEGLKAGKEGVTQRGPDGVSPNDARAKAEWQRQQADARKIAAAQKANKPEPRTLDHEGRPQDGKPIMPGDVFKTSSGRTTTPYPKYSTKRATARDDTSANQWLLDNAIAEAKARGDNFNATVFSGEKAKGMPPASVASMQEYLFGEQPKVVPPITKPIASGIKTQGDTALAGKTPQELLALAAPYTQYGPDYNRNIAASADQLRQSVERGDKFTQLNADELAVRLEMWGKPVEPKSANPHGLSNDEYFGTLLRAAADKPAELRPQDVDRVMSSAKPEDVERLRTWLLDQGPFKERGVATEITTWTAEEAPEPAAPKLRPGEKGTAELFQGADQPFNLAGESGVDNLKVAADKAKAEADAAEAKAKADRDQQPLFPESIRESAPATSIPKAEVQAAVAQIASRLKGAAPHEVVADGSEFPQSVKDDAAARGITDLNRIRGAVVDGKIFINAAAVESPQQAVETFLHEAAGHGNGVDAILNSLHPDVTKRLDAMLRSAFPDEYAAVAAQYRPSEQVSETMAKLMERYGSGFADAKRTAWNRIVDWVRERMVQLGWKSPTRADVEALLRRGLDRIRQAKEIRPSPDSLSGNALLDEMVRNGIEPTQQQTGLIINRDEQETKAARQQLRGQPEAVRLSVTPEQDARYLELAKQPEKNSEKLDRMVAEQAKQAGAWLDEDGDPQRFIRGGNERGKTEFSGSSFWTLDTEGGRKVAESYRDSAGDFLGREIPRAERTAQNNRIFEMYHTLPEGIKRATALSAAHHAYGRTSGVRYHNENSEQAFERMREETIKGATEEKWGHPEITQALKDRNWDEVLKLSEPHVYLGFEAWPVGMTNGEVKDQFSSREQYHKYVALTSRSNYFAPFKSITQAYLMFRNPLRLNGTGAVTPQIIAQARRDGYDAIWSDGAVGGDTLGYENRVPEIVALAPNQVKSSAAITRDASGKAIPLSERFNPSTPDIRFSISPDATSTKKAVTQAERAAEGRDFIETLDRPPRDQLIEVARQKLAAEPDAGKALVREINEGPFTWEVSDAQEAMLAAWKREVRTDKAVQAERAADPALTQTERDIAAENWDELEEENNAIDQATTKTGSAWHRWGMFRQQELRADFSFENVATQRRKAKGGEPLTREEEDALRAEIKTLTEAHDAEIKRRTELAGLERAEAVAAALQQGRAEADQEAAENQPDPAVTAHSRQFITSLNAEAAPARKRLFRLFSKPAGDSAVKMSIAPDAAKPPWFDDAVLEGAAIMAERNLSKEKWLAALKELTGDTDGNLDPHADSIRAASRKLLDDRIAADTEEVKRVKTAKMKRNASKEQLIDGMKERVAEDGDVSGLGRYLKKLAVKLIGEGVDTREPLIDALHDAVKDIDPSLTREKVMDLWSDYGQFTPATTEAVKVKAAQIRGEVQQVRKLMDMAKGLAAKLTGMGRVEPSAEHRKLTKEVEDAKRRGGFTVTDPARQLKAALDAIQTRLKNEIADMDFAIATRKPLAEHKNAIVYDAETKALKSARDAKKAEYSKLFPKDTAAADLAAIGRALDRSIAELTDQLKTGNLYPGKPSRALTSPEIEAKRAQMNALRDERAVLRGLDTSRVEAAKLEATQARVDELNRQRAAGWPETPVGTPTVDTPELAGLKETRDKLLKERAKAQRPPTDPEMRRIDSLDKLISEKQAKIASGDTSAKPKSQNVKTAEVTAKEEELIALNKQLARMRQADDGRQLEQMKARKTRQLADMLDKIARSDFEPKAKPDERPTDPELQAIEFQVSQAKEAIMEGTLALARSRRTKFQRARDFAADTFHTLRALMTGGEFSGVLRQGKLAALSHPIISFRDSVPSMFRAFQSPAKEHAEMTDIWKRDNAAAYKRSKLAIHDPRDFTAAQLEGNYRSRWANKIPFIAGSGRAYTMFLNNLRAGLFDTLHSSLASKDGTVTPEQEKVIATYINEMTGSGGLGKKGQQAAPILNYFLFAPKYVMSRFQMLTGHSAWKADAAGKKLVAKEYAKILLGASVMYALYATLKDPKEPIETDPRSTKFGKIPNGNGTYLDPLAGLSQATVFLSRLASGEIKDSKGVFHPIRGKLKFGQDNSFDLMAKFARSKASPLAGAVIDQLNGTDFTGQPVTVKGQLLNLATPMTYGDIYNAMRAQGAPKGVILSMLAMLGEGVNTFEDSDPKRRLEKEVRDGNRGAVSAAVSNREITTKDADVILKRAAQPQIALSAKGMTLEEMTRAYDRASAEDRRILEPILAQKRQRALDKSAPKASSGSRALTTQEFFR